MMQGWAKTVNNLMGRLEDTMQVLGIPDHEPQDPEVPKRSEPEQDQHDLNGLPGHDLIGQARTRFKRVHASETLSKLRAQFQNVSCAEAARAWCNVSYCHATGKLRVVWWTAAALKP